MSKNDRLNARLDGKLSRKVSYLRKRLSASTTDVVRRSIERYYDEETRREASGSSGLLASGFVGCAEGEADLSARYKEVLRQSLTRKL